MQADRLCPQRDWKEVTSNYGLRTECDNIYDNIEDLLSMSTSDREDQENVHGGDSEIALEIWVNF